METFLFPRYCICTFSHVIESDKFCLTKMSTVAEVQEEYIKDDDNID